MKGIVEVIRKWNRARREQRQLLKATGQLPGGRLSRLVYRVKAWNHERLAQHRLRRQLLSSLAANDTAALEALVFLLDASRREQRARSEAEEGLSRRLAALEERIDAGVRLVTARIQALEGQLIASTNVNEMRKQATLPAGRTRAPDSGGNGAGQHATLRSDYGEGRLERSAGGAGDRPEPELAAVAKAPKHERL